MHAVDRVFYHGGDIGERKADGQFDLPRAKEGGLGALFFSIFVTEDYYPARLETKQALRMLDTRPRTDRAQQRATIEIARNASDIERIRRSGKMAAVLDIEGSFDLDGDLGVLRADVSPRACGPCSFRRTTGPATMPTRAARTPKWHGLNDRGRALIREMNRLGMVINVSHASDEAIAQAIDASSDPVVATHHGLRAVNDIPRNMPDALMQEAGGEGRRLRLSARQRVSQSQGVRLGDGACRQGRSGTPAPFCSAARS